MSSQELQRDSSGEIRYGIDLCLCGHTWSEHYSPRPFSRRAGCWNTDKGRIDECGNFVYSGKAKVDRTTTYLCICCSKQHPIGVLCPTFVATIPE